MSITIALTTEQVFAAAQQLPAPERARLRALLAQPAAGTETNGAQAAGDPFGPGYSSDWSEEDLADARRATGLLIEERFGTEPYDYD